MLIDIDHFKAYNDRYGTSGRSLPARSRRRDPRRGAAPAARCSGAFTAGKRSSPYWSAAIAPLRPARPAACCAVADLKIAHSASTTRPCVTVSVGVSTVEPGGEYSMSAPYTRPTPHSTPSRGAGRDGWSFHEPAPADAGLLKTAS